MKDEDREKRSSLLDLFSSELERGEMLLALLEDVAGHPPENDLVTPLMRVKYKDIPYEICSHIKQLERLEELEEAVGELEHAVSRLASDSSTYARWVEVYPALSGFRK
jgi:hypothetical protein